MENTVGKQKQIMEVNEIKAQEDKIVRAELNWLEDPQVFQVNRLEHHSDHDFYESEDTCLKKEDTLKQSLNGVWKFAWSRCPKERPADFYKQESDLTDFGTIEVPGHMELQGYGGIHYTNTIYPWDGHTWLRPPHIDWEDNPVGSYVKEFDLKEEMTGKRICISFQGVEQAMYVWLNGNFIGYAEDTFTPSEFDLTDHILEKGNRLCVEVYKRSSAAWIEDQDFFRFSGIFRDVYLYAKPEIHVEDLAVQAGLMDDCLTGRLNVCAKISGTVPSEIQWCLKDVEGETISSGRLEKKKDSGNKESFWEMKSVLLKNIQPWNVGEAYLYSLYIKVYDAEVILREVVCTKVGFRRFEIKNKIMMLNGKRLEIHGVNRHEWNPRRGRAITREDMEKDIEILKKNHINAVRTSHYPNQSLWYELCDEAGICVMDETNLESHGSWQKIGTCEPSWNVPGSEKEWMACVVDRAAAMYERDKNHPSILWWSCGNESYAGECILEMSRYFHEKDSSRLVHYEGVTWNREFDEISDVESRMYAFPKDIRNYLENDPKKPFLLCEYMHDMGNSIGGMESYQRLLKEYPMYQGGFIWDYIDQAVYYRDADDRERLGYGGDFNDRPTDYAFCGNGIVFADRTEKPAMQEVRYWYSEDENRKKFDERNLTLRTEAERQLKEEIVQYQKTKKEEFLQVIHGDGNLGVKGNDFKIIFSYTEGGPVSLVYGKEECIYRAPKPAFWRASTENDKGNGFSAKSAVWMAADMFCICTECVIKEDGEKKKTEFKPLEQMERNLAESKIRKVEIIYTFKIPAIPGIKVILTYTVSPGGQIQINMKYHGKKDIPQLPLLGMRFLLPKLQNTVEWEGLSGETYPDRKRGGSFGRFQSNLEIPDYLVPQECGNHMDTVWVQAGKLIFVMKEKPFHFSALPYTAHELENALHKEELPEPGRTVVSILAEMRGVGGIDSWGADVEPEYHISAEEDIEYSFYIFPSDEFTAG